VLEFSFSRLMCPAKNMIPWIQLAWVVAFYLVGSLCLGMRGAIICFALQPTAALFVGVYIIALGADPIASQLTSWLAPIKHLVVLTFGGP
jgi:hypothetical protein